MRYFAFLQNAFRKLGKPPSGGSRFHGSPSSDLDCPILCFSRDDAFTLRHAVEGTCIWGAVGSGKSAFSGAGLLTGLLSAGCGGLICCVKPGEREAIESYLAAVGRSQSLIAVEPGAGWCCNLLDYVLKRPGVRGSRTEQVVNLLMTIVEVAERGEQAGGKNEAFWQRALKQRIRNTAEIFIAAQEPLSVAAMHRFMVSAPANHGEVRDSAWQERSFCYQLVQRGLDRFAELSPREQSDFDMASLYWLNEVVDFPPETRGSIAATWSTAADLLMRGQLADLFGSGTTFLPDMSFGGAVIVLDLPVKVYGQAGAVLQAAFKHVWELAAEQRDVKTNPRVAFLYIDEAQELVTEQDAFFFATARSSRIASVLISQNLSNYMSALGGEQGRHRVESMLGCLTTHIFHANGHAITNRWASEMIAEHTSTRFGWSRDQSGRGTGSGTESRDKKVPEAIFTELQKGGPPHFISEAIVFQGGRMFNASGATFMRVGFRLFNAKRKERQGAPHAP